MTDFALYQAYKDGYDAGYAECERKYKCKVEMNIYDEEEIHDNCTVQILRNSTTGDISVGWWENVGDGED